jgi:hypothetical protein
LSTLIAAQQRIAELEAALARLLGAFKADAAISPSLPVAVAWETNGEAIRQAEAALSV